MIFVYYGNRVSVDGKPRPFTRFDQKEKEDAQAMAISASALPVRKEQAGSGCIFAFFRLYGGKCRHMGFCSGSSVSSKTK